MTDRCDGVCGVREREKGGGGGYIERTIRHNERKEEIQ